MLDFIKTPDLGLNRDTFLSKVTRTVGKGNWFWVFKSKNRLYSWNWGLQLYEDAFWAHLRSKVDLLKDLVQKYENVYVVNRHDAESCLDYKIQYQARDHYNDIALRRVLVRFGTDFKGKDILSLEKSVYCQSKIPFHLPHLIHEPDTIHSVKSWMDTNRWIAVAPEIEDKAKLSELLVK